jgi:putative Mn2+ efflux pump MntP
MTSVTMSPIALFILAFSMSADAFAAALSKGASLRRPSWAEALRTGAIFGSIEAMTPVIGWTVGLAASAYIAAIDHWVAFVLLGAIGGKMIWESFRRETEDDKPRRHSLAVLVMTGIGTSLDAMAVGVTLALVGVDIVVPAVAIGAATCVMATLGVLAGRALGARFGKIAEAAGGVGLILIGGKILLEHTILA